MNCREGELNEITPGTLTEAHKPSDTLKDLFRALDGRMKLEQVVKCNLGDCPHVFDRQSALELNGLVGRRTVPCIRLAPKTRKHFSEQQQNLFGLRLVAVKRKERSLIKATCCSIPRMRCCWSSSTAA